jgi:hypothetical protein
MRRMIWNSGLWEDLLCFVGLFACSVISGKIAVFCWIMYLLVDVHVDARVLIFFPVAPRFFLDFFFSASPSQVDVCRFFL